MTISLKKYSETINQLELVKVVGKVIQVVGLIIEAQAQGVFVGELCLIELEGENARSVEAEVVGFKEGRVLLMPLGSVSGISPGNSVNATGHTLRVPVGDELLGRVLNGLGRPMDSKGSIVTKLSYPLDQDPPDPTTRPRIKEVLRTSVRAIDGLLTLGQGQRIGIFAGSGVGKSTLMGMLARGTEAEVNVIALVGERGREVMDFIEESLGEEGLKKSVVICATSDQPPLIRLKGALVGTAIAEYFRDQGKKVLFMMDSVTRFAMAQREVKPEAVEAPDEIVGYHETIKKNKAKIKELEDANDELIEAVQLLLLEKEVVTWRGSTLFTWKQQRRKSIDMKALQANDPDLYERIQNQYEKESLIRVFLTK
jgi:flagellum-specific ATP synthase